MGAGPHFLILAGDGINCERETAFAFRNASANASIVHVNDILGHPSSLKKFDGMALPGGFSFGDELGSGQILALKIKHGLGQEFLRFKEDQKPIIGICNGFQVLVKLGLLPWPLTEKVMALTHNESGTFVDRWTELIVAKGTVCKWTMFIKTPRIELPSRHGEGRIVFKCGREDEIYEKLQGNGQIPFMYGENINGSFNNIAGICDPTGLILGMMPHPEAYIFEATSRFKKVDPFAKGAGQLVFDSIIAYLAES